MMTNTVVYFVVEKFKILENKMNTTEVSENKQRLMGNLKSTFFFFHDSTVLVDRGLLIGEFSRPRSDISHSVGLLWTSDQPDAEISTRRHRAIA